MSSRKKTVMTELQKVQDVMQHTYHRISVIEKKLVQQQITLDNRESLELELSNAKDLLKKNEKKLEKLQKDNTKTFMIAACLIAVIYLVYGLYSMIFNVN